MGYRIITNLERCFLNVKALLPEMEVYFENIELQIFSDVEIGKSQSDIAGIRPLYSMKSKTDYGLYLYWKLLDSVTQDTDTRSAVRFLAAS